MIFCHILLGSEVEDTTCSWLPYSYLHVMKSPLRLWYQNQPRILPTQISERNHLNHIWNANYSISLVWPKSIERRHHIHHLDKHYLHLSRLYKFLKASVNLSIFLYSCTASNKNNRKERENLCLLFVYISIATC